MRVEIDVFSTGTDGRVFLSWTPVPATARLLDGPGGQQAVEIELRSTGSKGQVVFETFKTHRGTPSLRLSMPGDGSPVRFWVAGDFGSPSEKFGDAVITAIGVSNGAELATVEAMVRVRKSANALTVAERDRLVDAFGKLNARGAGRFTDFRTMHIRGTLDESHGNYGFLPWHRAYLLDLERELQALVPEVALPYWQFNKPAPNVFTREFLGVANSVGRLEFSNGHPFNDWGTDSGIGILRSPDFDTAQEPPDLKDEDATVGFGDGVFANFSYFNENDLGRSGIELDPHGYAHTSFSGWIRRPPTAPKDPLFFLLHCNVDRLWAKWQWFYKRHADTDPKSFPQGNNFRIGHNLNDTMWPWNGLTGDPRPPAAPGGTLAPSPLTTAPGNSPKVRSMLDFQGVQGGPHQGFDYDDVPFEIADAVS